MSHRFAFGQHVIADGDADSKATVVGVAYYPEGAVEFQLAYWLNGEHKTLWLPSWRLKESPE